MVFCTLETGIFELISEGQLMVRISKMKKKKSVKFKIKINVMDERFKFRKKFPVSVNVK
jgi:hypothetical protein